ncbi:MAG: hypothetical protein AMJ88_04550 [Anaerolineae bacterium SM23_ 63]|nr:MAG: hypothetical protein AMJ88_04550 [Anaerolineae bacterium SM23_ 63]HEY45293.1 DUF2029 domain-containing protein [Anaerolineae bacterium]
MNFYSSAWFRLVLIFLVLVMLSGLVVANYRFALQSPGGNEFLARWTGAHYWVVKGINPYDPQVSMAGQMMIYGRPADPSIGEDVAHFVYPLPAMLFFAPFGLLPFPLARAAWMTLLEIGLPFLAIMSVQLVGWKPSKKLLIMLMIFSVGWYHGFRAVIGGQFAVIEALLMVGGLLAIQKGQDSLAGVLFGLCIAKPHMAILLIPFVFLWALRAQRWVLISWMVGAVVVLIGVSLLLIGDWPLLWLRQMNDYSGWTTNPTPVSIIAGVFPAASKNLEIGLTVFLMLYLFWEWVAAMGKGDRWFQWTAAITIVITNIIPLRTATTHYVVLLPALAMIFSAWDQRWGKNGRIAIVFSLFLVLIGLWALFLISIEGNIENDIMYLPIPILCLFGLWWSRWWIVRAPSLRV